MIKRGKNGGNIRRSKKNSGKVTISEQAEEYKSMKIRRIFYILLDMIVLLSFSLALYFTYIQDYIRTIIFLIIGTLVLLFFILKRAFKSRR